jgi:hypothetical protein
MMWISSPNSFRRIELLAAARSCEDKCSSYLPKRRSATEITLTHTMTEAVKNRSMSPKIRFRRGPTSNGLSLERRGPLLWR